MKIYQFLSKAVAKTDALFCKVPIIFCALWAFCTNLIVEMLSRHSFVKGILHIANSPGVFFYNTLIVFAISLLCLFFRRRLFALVVSCLGILVLGIINCAVLYYRSTPLSATDFVKLSSVFGIFGVYLEGYTIVLMAVAIVLVIAGLVILFKFCRKNKREWMQGIFALPITVIVIALCSFNFVNHGILSKKFTNLPDAYRDYGFIYCFSCSVFDTGISRPVDYSPEKVNTILDDIRAEDNLVPEETPNVIFLQLESFFDVNKINNIEFSEDPTPFFNSLKENYPYAFLTVPYVGAGTANVEFEILTGMNLDFFGPGEYPYKTVLQTNACESLAFNLRELGYTSHAIHNHKANFYDRAHVFSSLGFDTFTSFEFMQDVEYNPIGWACDGVLKTQILKAMDTTETQDFIYTIGVQSHGIYPEEPIEGVELPVDAVMLSADTLVNENAIEYYVSQLREVDVFLEELVTALEERGEKTVLVVYGDHLPYLELAPEELENGSVYQTEYIVWSNFDLPVSFDAPDLYSYELAASIMLRLGINNGLITKLHQNCSEHPDYMKYLEMLQYDMLYGQKECYGYDIGYEPTDIELGLAPLTITDVKNQENGVLVTGTEFTPFSQISVNGEKLTTEFVDNNTLLVPGVEVLYGDKIVARQTNGKRTTFRKSEPYIADETVNPPPYDNPEDMPEETFDDGVMPENLEHDGTEIPLE